MPNKSSDYAREKFDRWIEKLVGGFPAADEYLTSDSADDIIREIVQKMDTYDANDVD